MSAAAEAHAEAIEPPADGSSRAGAATAADSSAGAAERALRPASSWTQEELFELSQAAHAVQKQMSELLRLGNAGAGDATCRFCILALIDVADVVSSSGHTQGSCIVEVQCSVQQ